MHKIKVGEMTYEVRKVYLIRDRDATLETISREGTGKASAFVIRFSTGEDVTKYEDGLNNGYDHLCLILTDDRTMYLAKPEYLKVAEQIVSDIDAQLVPRTQIN